MPPSNVLFWHKDYFELKSTENKQIKEKLSDFYVLKSSAKIKKKKKKKIAVPCLPGRTELIIADNSSLSPKMAPEESYYTNYDITNYTD